MGRRSKKKLTRAQHAPVPTAASPKDAHDDLPRLADYFWGLAVAAIFLAIKVIFIEHSAFGIKMERVGYELLQGRLGSHADAAAIIDISDLDQVGTSIEIEGGETKTLHVTPPDELRKIITTAAASEPRAIGVDINFAPYEAGTSAFLTPEHRELYDACLRANVPILLGIAAEQDAAPADRRRPDLFSRGPYGQLAAYLRAQPKDTRWMPPAQLYGVPTMGAALAQAYLKSKAPFDTSPNWFARQIIDYSPLKELQDARHTHRVSDARAMAELPRSALQGKIVLLGCATPGATSDTFLVEGHDDVVPGVDMLACAALTLIHRPLYEPTLLGRAVLDVVFSVALLLAFALTFWLIGARRLRRLHVPRVRWLCTAGICLLVLVVGVLAVRYTRLLWGDFLLVIPALLLHSSFERYLHGAWVRSRSTFTRWISKPSSEGDA